MAAMLDIRSERFYYFWFKVVQIRPTCSIESIGLSVHEKKFKKDFQDDRHGFHLVYPIRTILANLDQQVTLILPTKLPVNWMFGLEEVQNRFSRWPSWRPSWMSDRNDFRYVWFTSYPNSSYQVGSQLAQGYRSSSLLKQIVDATRRTTHDARDIDRSQKLNLSTSFSGELKRCLLSKNLSTFLSVIH